MRMRNRGRVIVFYFKMESKKIKRDKMRYLSKRRLKMLKLKKKTDQEEKSRSFSKQPEEVLDEETGATSSSTTVSEDERVLSVTYSSGSEYLPTPEKRQRLTEVEPNDLGMHLFVCLTSQVTSFIDQMNQNMVCRTPECSGTFVPVRAITEGMGGAIKIVIACNGCKMRTLTLDSSPLVESSRRTMLFFTLD